MGVEARTPIDVRGPVGGVWDLSVCVTDDTGTASTTAPTVTITPPSGTPETPTPDGTAGTFQVLYTFPAAGRYIARAEVVDLGVAEFAAYVTAVTAGTGMPDAAAVDDYLGTHSWTEAEIDDALAIEASAQRDVCTIPAAYPDALRGALLRRVQHNLAMRKLPIAMMTGDNDAGGVTPLPVRDPEVRRLERPYPRLRFGGTRVRGW